MGVDNLEDLIATNDTSIHEERKLKNKKKKKRAVENADVLPVEDDLNEPTIGEKVASLELLEDDKVKTPKIVMTSPCTKPPSADLVHVLLKQALRADDRVLLLDCLHTRDEKVFGRKGVELHHTDVSSYFYRRYGYPSLAACGVVLKPQGFMQSFDLRVSTTLFSWSFFSVQKFEMYILMVAAGSSIPEIKAYLNGVDTPNMFGAPLLVVKIIGSICAVSAGLELGKEGPLVHIGSCIASLLGQGGLDKHRLKWRWLRYFNNNRDSMDLIICGATWCMSLLSA
ncbi:hypothetical protein IFM89_016088 [Coptis chinensis]|uniref:Uncharacterized protein n=1 Tax=Coptis chinensis TaxID=261450 RepID=A0A835IPD8_9MAGN|nr:hypothetical protein IFM89_016088 [Coptis chinensis]